MMPTFPRSPLSFRTASFPQYGWKAGCPSGAFLGDQRLKPAPGIRRPPSSLHPPFVHLVVASIIPYCAGSGLDHAPPWWVTSPPPQGPSLGSGLFCPGPSSLNRPHPPHSQVHRDFTACRLIRDAFAVRERLGDPRAVPGFRCSFLPGMPSSPTPGRPASKCSRASMPTWPSPFDHRLGTPKIPAIRSTRASHFVASLVRFRYGLPGCSPPYTDQTGTPQPSGTFTSRLSTDRSPSPPLDITTTATDSSVGGIFTRWNGS